MELARFEVLEPARLEVLEPARLEVLELSLQVSELPGLPSPLVVAKVQLIAVQVPPLAEAAMLAI